MWILAPVYAPVCQAASASQLSDLRPSTPFRVIRGSGGTALAGVVTLHRVLDSDWSTVKGEGRAQCRPVQQGTLLDRGAGDAGRGGTVSQVYSSQAEVLG